MDDVLDTWLKRQFVEGMALAEASDVLSLFPEPGARPPRHFVAAFASPTMVREESAIIRRDGFTVLFAFPGDYLRSVPDAGRIVNLLAPVNAFHPNVAAPFLCIGRVVPGTSLVELVCRVYEIFTYQRMTPREDDALNVDACVWARRNTHLFPLPAAPLRRRVAAFSVEEVPQTGGGA
jgi:hypothetical protein